MKEPTADDWKKLNRLLVFMGPLVMVFVVTFVGVVYFFQSAQDANLAYAGYYYDDLATAFYVEGYDEEALVASGVAWRFCELYRIEIRTIDRRYLPLCAVIQERNTLLVACYDDSDGLYCTDALIANFTAKLKTVEHLGKELQDNPPYFGLVLSYDYQPMDCYLGGEKVKCPI